MEARLSYGVWVSDVCDLIGLDEVAKEEPNNGIMMGKRRDQAVGK